MFPQQSTTFPRMVGRRQTPGLPGFVGQLFESGPPTGPFWVVYRTPFLSADPVCFSSVSDSCFYLSCRLCLPFFKSFPGLNRLVAEIRAS